MTIAALITGKLVAASERKASSSGREYTRCRLAMQASEGSTQFVLVSAFTDSVQRVLGELGPGATVAISGSLKVGVWTPPDGGEPRPNLAMVADAVLTLHERGKLDRGVREARSAPHVEQQAQRRSPSEAQRALDEAR